MLSKAKLSLPPPSDPRAGSRPSPPQHRLGPFSAPGQGGNPPPPAPGQGPLPPATPDLGRGLVHAGPGPSSGLQVLLNHLEDWESDRLQHRPRLPWGEGALESTVSGRLRGRGGGPPPSTAVPLPTAPLPWTGMLSWAYTQPGCGKGGAGGAAVWNKETKPYGPPAHLSSPWTGSSCSHSPASTDPLDWGAPGPIGPTLPAPPPQLRPGVDCGDRWGLRWLEGWRGNGRTAFLPGFQEAGAKRETEVRVGDPKAAGVGA